MRGNGIRQDTTISDRPQADGFPRDIREAFRLRWKRRRLLWQAFRKRHDLTVTADRTGQIVPGQILAFSTVRNEALRLPHFLEHYRRIGVDHFVMVDNGSTDGTQNLLADRPDVSVWCTDASYRDSRFGALWLGWLLARFGHGHWCLTVDADEIIVYPHWDTRSLSDLAARLEAAGTRAMGALMLDLYPQGPLADGGIAPEDDPFQRLCWFDAGPYNSRRAEPMRNLIVQGGVRQRAFLSDQPHLGPTLNKIPFVRWNRRMAYANSTHSLLPRTMNSAYDGPSDNRLSGVLLHSKFLPDAVARSVEDINRRAHFANPDDFIGYYEDVGRNPTLWNENSTRYAGWRQLVDLGLMSTGGWE